MNGEARFGREVPASLCRLLPRSINGFSFWRLEVAVEAAHQEAIGPEHCLVIARHPYESLWSCLARFRPAPPDGEEVKVPPYVDTLESTQRYVDSVLPFDAFETGDRLVAAVSLPLNALQFDAGANQLGGRYVFGACVDPVAAEEAALRALGTEPLVKWTEQGTFHAAKPLGDEEEAEASRAVMLTAAMRLALAGPADEDADGWTGRAVHEYATAIADQLDGVSRVEIHRLRSALALSRTASRRFHAELPVDLEGDTSGTEEGRLIYECARPGELSARRVPMPRGLESGEILTKLQSLTLCCTDVSNLHGAIGHGHAESKILGHENCNRVIESRVEGIEPGSYVVPLGDDWLGLAEYEVLRPVLPEDDPSGIPLNYESRGGYFDPDSEHHIKAVCVVRDWRSGISLIEPLTHVYTYFATSQDARIARTVLVLGGGACGMFFCLFTKLFGSAKRVVLLDIMDERLEQAKALGVADEVLNPLRDERQCWDLVTETHGAYADVVFDALPGRLPPQSPPTRRIGMQLLRPQGEYIMYAAAADTEMPAIEMLAKGPRFHFAPYDSRVIDFTQRAGFMKRVLGWIETGLIRPERFVARQIGFHSVRDVQALFSEYGRTPELKVEILG